MKLTMSRRRACQLISGSGVALYVSHNLSGAPHAWAADPELRYTSPIDRTLSETAPPIWFSDYPDRAHTVLWNKDSFVSSPQNTTPATTEIAPLVIIGGGMSGLLTGYLLRKHNPIVLEQAPRFGGNAKGQSWHGIDYSLGAAYICEPDRSSPIEKLLKELDLISTAKIKDGEDPFAIHGSIIDTFWSGSAPGLPEATQKQIRTLKRYFDDVNASTHAPYPEVPILDPKQTSYIKDLDRHSFKEHLEKVLGEPLHGHLETAIEQYCWSSFGASASAVSAAGGINFYASEFRNIWCYPGGNAAIAERALERLSKALPAGNLRPGSLVYDVTVENGQARVSYVDEGGKTHRIKAKGVVMACPKFVVSKILNQIEPTRAAAIKRLSYSAYITANVCIAGSNGAAPWYDLYMLGDGVQQAHSLREAATATKATDVIFATFARANPEWTVLTLYRAFPYEGARGDLLSATSYAQYRQEFEKQISDSILPLLKIDPKKVVDMRLARWGHPLPIHAPNLIADGVVDTIRSPFKDRVFFVEQDNWALPAFETVATEALYWAPKIHDFLVGS